MKEKFIKFLIIAFVAFISARMACAADSIQQVKYPSTERIELGIKCDSLLNYKAEIHNNDSKVTLKPSDIINAGGKTFVFYCVSFFFLLALMAALSLILFIIAEIQRQIAKKR